MDQDSHAAAGTVTTVLPNVVLSCLTWGEHAERDRPLAVLLHGFPDTAHTWRHLGPALADAGYRVLAPFTRGYAPSGLAEDGIYHPAALITDALDLHAAHDGDGRAVLIGHDWGAITANGVAAVPDQPYGAIVSMAVPPVPTLRPALRDGVGLLPRQAAMSWYALFQQLPGLPERVADRLVARLWRRWSPAYDAAGDLALLADSIPAGPHRAAVFDYYRDTVRRRRFPAVYQEAAQAWIDDPVGPLLYLHGGDDGCFDVRWAARAETWAAAHPDADLRVAVIGSAGHFLHLERPGAVHTRILEFLAEVAP